MANVFQSAFNKHAYVGDTITATVDGFELVARIEYDDDAAAPWAREDGHGPVTDWTSRSKKPSERVLLSDHGIQRYYDFAEAVKIAERDGWDAPPYGTGTAKQRAARAAEADYQRLKAWCNNEWCYVGVVVSASRVGVVVSVSSLMGIESDCGDYLTEVANETADEALDVAKSTLTDLCGHEA